MEQELAGDTKELPGSVEVLLRLDTMNLAVQLTGAMTSFLSSLLLSYSLYKLILHFYLLKKQTDLFHFQEPQTSELFLTQVFSCGKLQVANQRPVFRSARLKNFGGFIGLKMETLNLLLAKLICVYL